MELHVPTLIAVGLIVNLTIGFICFSFWYGRKSREIYLWLGASCLLAAAACGSIGVRDWIPDVSNAWLAQALLLLGVGMGWAGIRSFERRSRNPICIIAGSIIWSLLFLVPQIHDVQTNRIMVGSLLTAIYYMLFSFDLLRGYRSEPSRGRIVACVFATIHIVSCLARPTLAYNLNEAIWPFAASSNLVGFFVLESIIAVIGLVLSLTTMERDRGEMEQYNAASTDVLTSALSRRAFIDAASDWIEKKGKDAALVLFDLDHFKKINDTFGHAGGDVALTTFAKLVNRRIEIANIIAGFNLDASTSNQYPRWYEATLADVADGGKPIFGRLGGEEFACLLPHLSLPQGLAIADDIRCELANMKITLGGQSLRLTVSGSIVSTADIGHRLDIMLSTADHALYRAKDNGRNRIEIAVNEPFSPQRHTA